MTITLPVSVAANLPDGTTLPNLASAVSDERTTPVEDDGSLVVSTETDVAIVKTGTPSTVDAGTPLAYDLAVENNGPSDAQNVVITDVLPTRADLRSRPTRRAPTTSRAAR